MSGSMRLVGKPDTWELRVFIGRDSLGKVKHRYVRFRGTRRQAERELARLVVAQDENPVVVTESALAWGSSTTINDAIAAWRGNGWADLSPTTVRHYQELWDRHISSSVGRRAISGLTSYEVKWVNTLVGNTKKFIDGTYNGREEYKQLYLEAFMYRFNR